MTVVQPLPLTLHGWAPIVRSGSSATHSITLIRSTATGRAGRSGAGSAFVLTALSTAAAGFKSTAGEGHYAERPITLGEATGARPYEARLGYGAEHPLTLPTNPGVGHKSTNGFGAVAVRPLTLKPASGLARMRGRALALMLPLALRPAAGSKGVAGSGGNDYRLDASLLRSAPGYPGVHREWHLTPPITTDRYLLEPLHSRRLAGANDYGHTLTVGDRVYPGGGVFQLTDAERAELIDAGYGDLLSLKEVR